MRIAGVDPGLKGALAFADIHAGVIERAWVYDMPVTELVDGRPLPDARAIFEIAQAERADTVVLEHVEARPRFQKGGGKSSGGGAASEWRFALGFGRTQAALQLADTELRVHLVRPKVWKAAMGLSSDKKASLAMARCLFPQNADALRLEKHDGRAEALLLIEYFRQHLLVLPDIEVC